jgi:2-polyprenyl-3-methyl-5-hydroxy-6-metoxy-1,4-benzoquinol methylase
VRESGFTLNKCCDCGLLYVSPRPDPETISEANKVGVHATESGALNVTAKRVPSKVGYYAGIIGEMFAEETGRGIRWLDVGAGYGEFVEAVSKALPQAEVAGIEPMLPKVDVAKARGLPVDARSLDDVGSGYDVISLINVFSHIPDFKDFGAQLSAKLNPGGILFLETGNVPELDRPQQYPDIFYLPDHLVFAGVSQMRDILDAIGAKLIAHRRLPIDGPAWCAKQFVKGLLKGKVNVMIPGRSPFRTVFYKAAKL